MSLLYGILEGACNALDIERQDVDGTLYTTAATGIAPLLYCSMMSRAGQATSGTLPKKPTCWRR